MQLPALLVLALLMSACGALTVPVAAPLPVAAAPIGSGPVRLWQDRLIFDGVRGLAAETRGHLLVEMYEFGRRDLARLLREVAARGVDVRLVYDPSVAATAATAAGLRAAGLAVRAYPLDDRRHQIDHVKLVLADGAALVGGMNWGAGSAGNHDYALETRAPDALARLRAIFEQDWALAGGSLPPPVGTAAGDGEGDVVQTAPGKEIRGRLLALVATARRTVDAEVFALTDPEVLSALAAARRRGTSVRVLLDPGEDVNRPSAAALERNDVAVRFYPVAPGSKLHAKAGLFDGRLLLGSANWSASGLGEGGDHRRVSGLQVELVVDGARFEADWAAAGGLRWPG